HRVQLDGAADRGVALVALAASAGAGDRGGLRRVAGLEPFDQVDELREPRAEARRVELGQDEATRRARAGDLDLGGAEGGRLGGEEVEEGVLADAWFAAADAAGVGDVDAAAAVGGEHAGDPAGIVGVREVDLADVAEGGGPILGALVEPSEYVPRLGLAVGVFEGDPEAEVAVDAHRTGGGVP